MIAPNQGDTLYRIPIDEDTISIGIVMKSSASSASLPPIETLSLLDPHGQMLMEAGPDPKTQLIRMDVELSNVYFHAPRPRDLYLQISELTETAGSGSAGSTSSAPNATPAQALGTAPSVPLAPSGFVLTVQRQNEGFAFLGEAPLSAAVYQGPLTASAWARAGPVAPSSPNPSPGSLAPASQGASGPDLPGPVPMALAVATGPLPARAAAPLGGILSDGDDPTPVVDRGAAGIDLALIELAAGGRDGAPAPDPGAREAPRAGGPIVALRGPGGFPLLGSSLIAGGRRSRPASPLGPPLVSFVGPNQATSADPSPGPAAEPPQAPIGLRAVRRVSALAGVSVALAFISGVVLPDLTDPCRVDRPVRSRLRSFLSKLDPGGRP
jgi:hypothetical protein